MDTSIKLRVAIENIANGYRLSSLQKISSAMTQKYKAQKSDGTRLITSREEALVYAIVRMPATYSAIISALSHTLELIDSDDIETMLDVGAGTGAATWAACDFLNLSSIDCIEREKEMIAIGKKMMEYNYLYTSINWIMSDIFSFKPTKKYDIVIASYSLNEMSAYQREITLNKLWSLTNKLLLIIEPGTPYAYEMQKEMRQSLIELGATLIAPCPYNSNCLLPNDDWCHFTCRVQRSKLHKQVKEVDSPFEDEKFTYSAFSRCKPHFICEQRIIRHPIISEKKISLQLCTSKGIETKILYKKDGALYKKAKKLGVGDTYLTQQTLDKGDN